MLTSEEREVIGEYIFMVISEEEAMTLLNLKTEEEFKEVCRRFNEEFPT